MKTTKKTNWVFWFKISIRRKWFSYWWSTRGANFKEYQIWIFKISIGQPWLHDVIEQETKGHADNVNSDNKKMSFSRLIKQKYVKREEV